MNQDIGELLRNVKIKDTRSLGAVAMLVVAMALFVVAATGFVRQLADRRAAEADLADVQEAIAQIESLQTANPDALRERIAAVRDELDAALVGMPTKEQASAELARYYEYAREYNTQLARMESVPGEETLDEVQAYSVERYLITVRGRAPDLLAFFGRLADGPYDTIVIDNLSITADTETVAEADLYVYYSDLSTGEIPAISEMAGEEQVTPEGGEALPAETPAGEDEATPTPES
jgi:Tfp pilus assembly protein PilO